MKYENITPEDYVERKFCAEVYSNLTEKVNEDIIFLVRAWDQAPPFPQQRYISIVTSAEGHQYVPPEKDDPNCLGVFMHYYPKTSVEKQFDPDNFMPLENVYAIPLGETKFFKGDNHIPIMERTIDVSFVGQFDPYRRVDFFNEVVKVSENIDNSVFQFYEGWNNGIGDKYSEIMSNTKVALVPCGSASLDTFRLYEAYKCGCVIIAYQQNNYEFMKNPVHMSTPSWEGLYIGLEVLFKRQDIFQAYSGETRSFWEKRLSPLATAKLIYKKIKDKLCKE